MMNHGKMDCFGRTDVGRKRGTNEDQFLIANLTKSMHIFSSSLNLSDETLFGGSQGMLLLVADGIGGHAAGERASQIAVETVSTYILNTMPWFFRLDKEHDDDFQEELRAALRRCQNRLNFDSHRQPDHRGMGTTLTIAYLIWPRMYVVHVGDSRCYLLRDEHLEQITTDHTVAQRMLDEGLGETAMAKSRRWANTLWNVLGADRDDVVPDVYRVDLRLGDRILLCTDGLSKHVAGERILRILGRDASAERITAELIDAANSDGGSDNITAVVARFGTLDTLDRMAAEEESELEDDEDEDLAETQPVITSEEVIESSL